VRPARGGPLCRPWWRSWCWPRAVARHRRPAPSPTGGSCSPATSRLPPTGTGSPMSSGFKAYGYWTNRQGGVNGHRVLLSVVDDAADPPRPGWPFSSRPPKATSGDGHGHQRVGSQRSAGGPEPARLPGVGLHGQPDRAAAALPIQPEPVLPVRWSTWTSACASNVGRNDVLVAQLPSDADCASKAADRAGIQHVDRALSEKGRLERIREPKSPSEMGYLSTIRSGHVGVQRD
jgi:hypothetical protein